MHNLKMGLSKSCIATQEEFGVEIDQLFKWPITKFFFCSQQPKIRMYSKYERRTDTRTYEDRRKLYEGVSIMNYKEIVRLVL